jgi:hypothetical protein
MHHTWKHFKLLPIHRSVSERYVVHPVWVGQGAAGPDYSFSRRGETHRGALARSITSILLDCNLGTCGSFWCKGFIDIQNGPAEFSFTPNSGIGLDHI